MKITDTQHAARRAVSWHRAGMRCWWVTVLGTFGSSPAPAGSTLALSESEEITGNVGLPAMERLVTQRILSLQPSESVEWVIGGDSDSARALDFPAGADPLTVWVEPVTDSVAGGLASLVQLLEDRRSGSRNLRSGAVQEAHVSAAVLSDGDSVVHHPPWRLLISGASPVALELCRRSQGLQLDCVVIEPRPEFQSTWPEAVVGAAVHHEPRPADAVLADTRLDARSAVLALAHDPAIDDPLLYAALGTPVFLLGALGSRANHAARLQRLAARGATDDVLTRIQGPVGLDIGSRSPAEISVAIIAQVILSRRVVSA